MVALQVAVARARIGTPGAENTSSSRRANSSRRQYRGTAHRCRSRRRRPRADRRTGRGRLVELDPAPGPGERRRPPGENGPPAITSSSSSGAATGSGDRAAESPPRDGDRRRLMPVPARTEADARFRHAAMKRRVPAMPPNVQPGRAYRDPGAAPDVRRVREWDRGRAPGSAASSNATGSSTFACRWLEQLERTPGCPGTPAHVGVGRSPARLDRGSSRGQPDVLHRPDRNLPRTRRAGDRPSGRSTRPPGRDHVRSRVRSTRRAGPRFGTRRRGAGGRHTCFAGGDVPV
jgi:hypothetical protein